MFLSCSRYTPPAMGPSARNRMDGMQIVRVLGTLLLWCIASLAPAADFPSVYPQARTIFPDAEAYGGFEGKPPSVAAYRGGRIIGYLFLTEDVLRIPAYSCLLYTSPSPRDRTRSRMPSSA